MPWDFGAGDIISGLRLAFIIYECGFVEENSADARYRTFQNDILNFRQLLERLGRSLQNAQERYKSSPIHARATARAIEPLSEEFERERITIIGDFNATLEECDALLKRNKELRQRHSNVLSNLRWHLNQQEQRVDDLRRRLHIHAEKIRLVIDRLSIDLLSDLDAGVDDLLGLAERNIQLSNDILLELNRFRSTLFGYLAGHGSLNELYAEDTHVASVEVAQRFLQGSAINPPPGVESDIPLVEGFDALFVYFEQSVEGSEQTPEKYLQFLKSRWLLDLVKNSQDFNNARPGFYYKRAINQIEQGISARARAAGDIVAYDDATLLGLPESSFLIWPPAPQAPATRSIQPHPLSVRANEQEILRIRLASDENQEPDVVTIFQHSPEHFRIVLETRSAENERTIIPQAIYAPEDSLIPRYALPSLTSPSREIATFSKRFGEEILYKFDSEQDLWRFQKALTGYDVSHDQRNILYQFGNDEDFVDSSGGCSGRIQLWQDPIVFQGGEQLTSSANTTRRSSSLTSTGFALDQRSLVSSIGPTNTISRTQGGWQADNVKLPAITVFTQVADRQGRDRFAIIFIELTTDIEIDPAECSCHSEYDSCANLVLIRRNKSRLPLRVLYSELDSQGSPNPSTFDLLPFRLPRQPKNKGLIIKKTDYVVMKFQSLAEKKLFHRELNLRFKVRAKQIQTQDNFSEAVRLRQDRPKKNIKEPMLRRPSLQHGLLPVRKVQTLPRHVEMPYSGPSFGDSFSPVTEPRPMQDASSCAYETRAIQGAVAASGWEPMQDLDTRGTEVKTLRDSIAQRMKFGFRRSQANSHKKRSQSTSSVPFPRIEGNHPTAESTEDGKGPLGKDVRRSEGEMVTHEATEQTSPQDGVIEEAAEQISIGDKTTQEGAEHTSTGDNVKLEDAEHSSIEKVALVQPALTSPTERGQPEMPQIPQIVTWTCSCGMQLYDHYTEIIPGSIEQLQKHLQKENLPSMGLWHSLWDAILFWSRSRLATIHSGSANQTDANTFSHAAPTLLDDNRGTSGQSHTGETEKRLPTDSTLPSAATEIFDAPHIPQEDPAVSYLLLCFPEGLSGLRLHHQQILQTRRQTPLPNQVTNDRQLFSLLRKKYASERRRFITRFSPKTVIRVSLAYFLVDMSDYVELKHYACRDGQVDCRCIPPPEMIRPASNAQYHCIPRQPQLKPPIGTNYLTHYFQNPGCIKSDNLSYTLNQVPKRLGQCMATSGSQRVEAWGMEFEEGWDRGRLRNAIFGVVVIGCLLFAILWSVFAKDMQGAFALASFFVALLTIAGAYIASAEPRIVHK